MNLVVALRAEAEPVIEYFQLEAGSADGLFTIYRGESVWLVISGVGRVLAGAAVAPDGRGCLGPAGICRRASAA